MPREKSVFICQNCAAQFPKWQGQCPQCGQWQTLVETVVAAKTPTRPVSRLSPLKLSQIKKEKLLRLKTGVSEFDQVLGGGLVPGSVILLAGEPGIGKSTLLTQVIAKLGGLYISGEESPEQLKIRTRRLKIEENFLVYPETHTEAILEEIQKQKKLNSVIIDSIQSLWTERLTGTVGSVGQVRETANMLLLIAKATNIPVMLIGHVTKEGAIAGPKVLEHLVDVVLYLEGDRQHDYRILRCTKNRFGPTDEVAIFKMTHEGLSVLKDSTQLFLSSKNNVPGRAITCLMQGLRPMLVEVQGLSVSSRLAVPRRVAQGINFRKLQVLTAVLQKRANLALGSCDVFVNVVGGLKVEEPAADLAIVAAIASSFKNKKFTQKTVIIGEVGLLGEVRGVNFLDKRIKEARSLGFRHILSPKNCPTIRHLLKNLVP